MQQGIGYPISPLKQNNCFLYGKYLLRFPPAQRTPATAFHSRFHRKNVPTGVYSDFYLYNKKAILSILFFRTNHKKIAASKV